MTYSYNCSVNRVLTNSKGHVAHKQLLYDFPIRANSYYIYMSYIEKKRYMTSNMYIEVLL
jgi:hypothetical protein